MSRVLEFPVRSVSGERLAPLQQVICCYWRRAHYGGRYLMFLCSECGRSARVLYARYFYDRIWFFSCRNCAGITYQSTMGHRWDRSARKRLSELRPPRRQHFEPRDACSNALVHLAYVAEGHGSLAQPPGAGMRAVRNSPSSTQPEFSAPLLSRREQSSVLRNLGRPPAFPMEGASTRDVSI
jgi:hypothetical protein